MVSLEHYYTESPSSLPRLGLIRCKLRGLDLEFLTASGVFSYRNIDAGTSLLVEAMILPENGRVLDLGCGYGVIGIAAARLNPSLEVWLTDVNERAVLLAYENVKRNRVRNARVLRGFLYEALEGTLFNAILTNPPISAGLRVLERLVEGSLAHLKMGGSLQMVVRTNKGGRQAARMLEDHYGGFEVIARRGGYRVLKAERG
ncbi:class I SAM-dependent methyltransferase [Candidatus Bathyarchaeota archaeon]|nr:class I SAM-dependent methyltransferase [Candidatus Bathyarchaeota archaeon]